MQKWHGWIIEQSLDDQSIFSQYVTVKMKSNDVDWKEHILEIPDETLLEVIEWLEIHLLSAWYAHFLKENEIAVIFKSKSFRLKQGESFDEVQKYGRSQGIIEEQLPGSDLFQLARDSGY